MACRSFRPKMWLPLSTWDCAQAPPGASGVIDAAAKPSKHGEARRRVRAMSDAQQEETLRRFIKLAIKGRLHQAVLNHLVTRMMISINPKSVATSLAANPDDVVKVLRDWKKVGIVKTMGAHPYAYQPSEDDRESINLFCRLWRDRRWHPKLLAMIKEGK